MGPKAGVALITGLLLAACSGSTPEAQPGSQAPTTAPNHIPPRSAIQALTPSSSATLEADVLFHDPFEGSLTSGWIWMEEINDRWSLSATPGSLRIILNRGNLKNPRNLLLRKAPEGDFQISTLLRFTPSSNFQFAGLVVYQDPQNHLQHGRAFAQCDAAFCKGNALYFDSVAQDRLGPSNFATLVTEKGTAYLRIRRRGSSYTAQYSSDGRGWTEIGRHTNHLTPIYVGLMAGQAYQAEAVAEFEFFTIEALSP
jgi:beta-xylosidase